MIARSSLRARNNTYIYFSFLVTVLVVGTMLRIGSVNFDRIPVMGDEMTYINAANSLLDKGYLTLDPYNRMASGEILSKPSPSLAAGFPIFLAGIFSLFGTNSKILVGINVALSIVSLVLCALILIDLPIRRWCKIIGIILIAIYPGFLYSNDRILTEPLFSAFFIGFFFTVLKGVQTQRLVWFAMAGILIGIAIQIRAFALPFLLLACVMLFVYRGKSITNAFLQIGVISAPAVGLVMAWVIFNWHLFHVLYLFPDTSYSPRVWGAMPYFLDMEFTNNRSLQKLLEINQRANSNAFWNWRIFGFFQYMWGDIWDEYLTHRQPYLRPLIAIQLLVVVPTLIALPFTVRAHRPTAIFIACTPIAFTLMNMPFHGMPRYVWPSIPFVFITLAILLDQMSGSSFPDFKFTEGNSRKLSSTMHATLLVIAMPFSIVLAYSVYVFAWDIEKQMSDVRLGRYSHTSIEAIERRTADFSAIISSEKLTFDNVAPLGRNSYVNNTEYMPILKFINPLPLLDKSGKVVTKISVQSNGGYMFDFMTIYWTGKNTPEISENKVYGRFPINFLEKEQIVYIDDDVTNVVIVPAGFRGSSFTIGSIAVEKFVID